MVARARSKSSEQSSGECVVCYVLDYRARSKPLEIILVAALLFIAIQPAYAQIAKPAAAGSIVMVDTDDSCRLTVDDRDEGIITPDHAKKISVGLGDHILKCGVENVPDLCWRKIVQTKKSGQTIAMITLRALHIRYEQAVAQADQRKAQSEQAARAAADRAARQQEAASAYEAKRQRIQAQIDDLKDEAEATEGAAENFDQQARILEGPASAMAQSLAAQKRREVQRLNARITGLQSQM
jgi:hypothetical protein